MTGKEHASVISEAAGKLMRFVIVEEARAGIAGAGVPAPYIDFMIDIENRFLEGSFDVVTGDVDRLAGRKPHGLLKLYEILVCRYRF